MEKLKDMPERQIMPQNLFRHYVDARNKAHFRSGESTYVPDNSLQGFKVFKWQNPDLPFHFEDHYVDTPERPGNFGGFEINRANSDKGETLTFYNYCGGLTEEGLKVGEVEVYDKVLQRFLEEHVEEIRFGKNVRFTIEDEDGTWVYEGDGEVKHWGWEDKETIKLNDKLIYELNGKGLCFIKGF